ncbi:hypothetical protein M438DRAFT_342321 [Aureobasidium pullulans EXF-150]|uniref:Uncharacterized protein n=1 Tax=Aureobasidium pullulans EXF-150 TaxID=1043002 RepID=A0A074Y3L4_AURPU|nr:uncharacterized protein M438DRAFT_342321 [Aureobasidium pullulans EXF-150]KEQ88777.1 hypothetical protein M438DRAFT_342321 [Aureobasidium pullulans EXF-150]
MPLSCVLVIIAGHSQKPLAADITTTYLHKSSKRAPCSFIPSVTKSQAALDISQVPSSLRGLPLSTFRRDNCVCTEREVSSQS